MVVKLTRRRAEWQTLGRARISLLSASSFRRPWIRKPKCEELKIRQPPRVSSQDSSRRRNSARSQPSGRALRRDGINRERLPPIGSPASLGVAVPPRKDFQGERRSRAPFAPGRHSIPRLISSIITNTRDTDKADVTFRAANEILGRLIKS